MSEEKRSRITQFIRKEQVKKYMLNSIQVSPADFPDFNSTFRPQILTNVVLKQLIKRLNFYLFHHVLYEHPQLSNEVPNKY